jgi:hypothetical protein
MRMPRIVGGQFPVKDLEREKLRQFLWPSSPAFKSLRAIIVLKRRFEAPSRRDSMPCWHLLLATPAEIGNPRHSGLGNPF